jgi:hypothetical protein
MNCLVAPIAIITEGFPFSRLREKVARSAG